MDPHHLDVENFDFGIDACNEFNPFEDAETPTSSNVPPSNLPQPNPTGKRPRVSRHTSMELLHYNKWTKYKMRGRKSSII